MKRTNRERGFALIEIMVVVGIIAILAAIATLAYVRIQERAERAVAIDNAQTITSCINAHNRAATAEDDVIAILGAFSGEYVILSGVDTGGNTISNIDTLEEFNSVCENNISLLTGSDYDIAMEYITILSPNDEFSVKPDYDHTDG